jgi:hypothetical protein
MAEYLKIADLNSAREANAILIIRGRNVIVRKDRSSLEKEDRENEHITGPLS